MERLTESQRTTFMARGRAIGFPLLAAASGAMCFEGEQGYERLVEPTRALYPGSVAELEAALTRAEDEHAGRMPPSPDRAADADGPDELGDGLRAELQRDALERAAYRRSPEAVLDALERIEALLREGAR
ncbi:MAG: hypothetical protein AB7H93_16525 [Vicinamibacterales bacterium]